MKVLNSFCVCFFFFLCSRGVLPAGFPQPTAPPSPICTTNHPIHSLPFAEDVPRRDQGAALPRGEGQGTRAVARRAEAAQRGGPDSGRQGRGGAQGEEQRSGSGQKHGEGRLVLPSSPPPAEVVPAAFHSGAQTLTSAAHQQVPRARNGQRWSGRNPPQPKLEHYHGQTEGGQERSCVRRDRPHFLRPPPCTTALCCRPAPPLYTQRAYQRAASQRSNIRAFCGGLR